MVSQITPILVALAAGVGLGLAHFGVLWLSVRRLPQTQRPLRWLFATGLIRFALLGLAVVLVMDASWERLLACMVGFLAGRQMLIRGVAGGLGRVSG